MSTPLKNLLKFFVALFLPIIFMYFIISLKGGSEQLLPAERAEFNAYCDAELVDFPVEELPSASDFFYDHELHIVLTWPDGKQRLVTRDQCHIEILDKIE